MSQWIKLLTAAALWTVVLMFAGCAGITPYDPPAHGELPPGRGLFSGADGEFVIYQKADEVDPDGEAIENKKTGQKQP
jgi:hypothetical protein